MATPVYGVVTVRVPGIPAALGARTGANVWPYAGLATHGCGTQVYRRLLSSLVDGVVQGISSAIGVVTGAKDTAVGVSKASLRLSKWALLRLIVVAVVTGVLLAGAVSVYGLFYSLYVPTLSHRWPVYLQFAYAAATSANRRALNV